MSKRFLDYLKEEQDKNQNKIVEKIEKKKELNIIEEKIGKLEKIDIKSSRSTLLEHAILIYEGLENKSKNKEIIDDIKDPLAHALMLL